MIKLGHTYVDVITGFTGICAGRVEYLSGCNQALLVPKVSDEGAMRDAQWFDDQRLKQTDAQPISLDNSDTPGFDKPAPKR